MKLCMHHIGRSKVRVSQVLLSLVHQSSDESGRMWERLIHDSRKGNAQEKIVKDMSEESSELIERVNLAAKRFVEAKAAAKKQQEDEEERGFRDISPSSSSSSYNPSSSTDFSYGVMNADDVLKSMVARKVEMQNTAMDLDTSRKFEDMQNEVSKLSEEFDRNKPTAGNSSHHFPNLCDLRFILHVLL